MRSPELICLGDRLARSFEMRNALEESVCLAGPVFVHCPKQRYGGSIEV